MFRSKKRSVWIGIAAALVICGSTMTAYADTLITDVRIRFTNNYDNEGGSILEPAIEATGSGYEIESISWSKEADKWNPGSKITATILLTPGEGRSFKSTYKSQDVSLGSADFISAKKDDEGESLILKAGYYPVVQLGVTEKASWSDTAHTRAVWKKVPYATAYQLRLYTGNDEYVKTITMEGTAVDLSEYITKEANYFYEVRATSKNTADAGFMRSGEYVTSADTFVENIGETQGRWHQYREGYKYTDAQGAEAVSSWRFIQGNWYYFNAEGYTAVGWCPVGDKWYYMNEEGKMQTGWLNLDNKWYYTDITGAMVTGWYQTSPSEQYYFYSDGSMAANTVIEGRVLTETGKMQ